MSDNPEPLISYAQNREDIILYAFFRSLSSPGHYVDVGAYHPEDDSVTKFFYDRGWRGINIEPNDKLLELFKKDRPEDINLNVGVSDKPGQLSFREYKNQGLSTFSENMKKEHAKAPSPKTGRHSEKPVKVMTLAEILDRHKIGTIHFLKIDVEGLEYEVLEGNNWDKYRPLVVCAEANHIFKDWRKILKANGYTKVFFDGLNEYYVANEHPELMNDFSYTDVFLEGSGVTDIHSHRKKEQLIKKQSALKENQTKLKGRLQNSEQELVAQQQKIAETAALLEHAQGELARQRELKHQLKILYASLDNKIMTYINTRGYSRRTRPHVSKLRLTGNSREELMRAARLYDVDTYYRSSPGRKKMKLHYRVSGKLYRITRDTALRGARKGYHLARRGSA